MAQILSEYSLEVLVSQEKKPRYVLISQSRPFPLPNIYLVHRLVELAEFYKLGGYQDWSQMHQADMSAEGDSSDSSDVSFPISREEAVRRFPEAAHQALAATLGLVYYKIRNEVGEGPNVLPSRSLKRQQEDVASASAVRKAEKPIKIPRRPSVSETLLERLVNGPGPFVTESQSSRSEEFDQLGWDVFSGVSEDAMSKLRSIDRQDIGTILRALEQGRLKLKPSESEKARMSPDASPTQLDKSIRKSEVSTEPNTSSQPFSLPSRTAQPTSVPDIPEPASDSDSSTS